MKGVKIILLFLLLISIPTVLASISFNSLTQTKYNVGEKLLVSGTVQEETAVRAYLNFYLSCGSNKGQIAAMLLDLQANKATPFSQLISLPKNLVGECTVNTILNDINNGNVIESKDFLGFSVSNDLNGQFEINKKELQLGDTLSLKGRVLGVNEQSVNGIATIYFKQSGNTIFVDNTKIENGIVGYNKSMSLVPTGNYDIDIEISDNLGNGHNYQGLYQITVNGNLEPTISFNKDIYDPGETVVLNGMITTVGKVLNDVSIEFTFDGKEKVLKTLKTSAETFTVSYNTLKNTKTGSHTIGLVIKNPDGNYKTTNVNYTIRAIPTTLTITTENASILPEEDVNFKIGLLDQAEDEMNENVAAGILDVDGKAVDSKIVKTNSKNSIRLPKSALPGTWKVRVEGLGLNAENAFTVKELKALDIKLEGTLLHITNVGNVQFKEDLEIEANNTNYQEEVNLKIGKLQDIDLQDILPNGLFDVTIPLTNQEFKDVRIDKAKTILDGFKDLTGNVASNVESPERKIGLYILLFLLVGSIVFLLVGRRGKKYNKYEEMNRRKDYEQGQRKLNELKSKGIRKPELYGKATQEDVDDFKQRMLNSWKQEEKRQSEKEFVNGTQNNYGDNSRQSNSQQNNNQDKTGFFGRMFD